MDKVAVLMSTYNGEKYLREQIDSILTQEDVELTLYIRDDGSSDGTIEIVQEYQKRHNNIKLDNGKNLGVGNSFMQLVYDCPDEFDYYAFADQDDVWLPEKLKAAIEKIQDTSEPALYCSNQILVDGTLKRIGMRYDSAPDVSYQQIICQNKVTGCTMLWNKDLQRLLSDEMRRPSEALLRSRIHDVWVAIVAAVVGDIHYDSDGYILYRQHETNVVGVKKANIIKQWLDKLKDSSQRNGRSLLCREVYERFKDDIVSENMKNQLDVYGNYGVSKEYKRIMLRDKELISHTGETQLGFRIKVLLNLI